MAIEDFYTDFCQFKDPELVQTLVYATSTCSIKKGNFLVNAGESQLDICFLTKGLLRGFFLEFLRGMMQEVFGACCLSHSGLV